MKIVATLREACPNGIDCPRVYELDDGQLAIQGERAAPELLAQLGLPAHETLIVVPRSMLPEV